MIGKDNKYKRSLRRHHKDRLWKKLVKNNTYDYIEWFGYEEGSLKLKVFVDTPCRCSGYCCGNPRKWFGELTVQERRFA